MCAKYPGYQGRAQASPGTTASNGTRRKRLVLGGRELVGWMGCRAVAWGICRLRLNSPGSEVVRHLNMISDLSGLVWSMDWRHPYRSSLTDGVCVKKVHKPEDSSQCNG